MIVLDGVKRFAAHTKVARIYKAVDEYQTVILLILFLNPIISTVFFLVSALKFLNF